LNHSNRNKSNQACYTLIACTETAIPDCILTVPDMSRHADIGSWMLAVRMPDDRGICIIDGILSSADSSIYLIASISIK